MKLSIVVPAYNEENVLPQTLQAINIAATSLSCEMIVVDNDSTDRTREIADANGAIIITEHVHNIGRVRNTGAARATGDVLIFVDADTVVPASLFESIASSLQDEKCLGGAVAVDYGEFSRTWMKWYLKGWAFWGSLFNMKQGAAQFCRRNVFAQVGGYDESIFVGEDIEFYWRLSKFARRHGGFLTFIEHPRVVTSARRFDRMSLWKTFVLTHPLVIRLNWKRQSVWKDWYDDAVR